MTKRKVMVKPRYPGDAREHGARWKGDTSGTRALKTPKELLRAAEARVVELTTQMAQYRKYFDQDAYVRQLQGELYTFNHEFEKLKEGATDREKELQLEVDQLHEQRDILIHCLGQATGAGA